MGNWVQKITSTNEVPVEKPTAIANEPQLEEWQCFERMSLLYKERWLLTQFLHRFIQHRNCLVLLIHQYLFGPKSSREISAILSRESRRINETFYLARSTRITLTLKLFSYLCSQPLKPFLIKRARLLRTLIRKSIYFIEQDQVPAFKPFLEHFQYLQMVRNVLN